MSEEKYIYAPYINDQKRTCHVTLSPLEANLQLKRFLRKQVGRDGPVGDLAGDAVADENFPERGTLSLYQDYLASQRACESAQEVLIRAFKEAMLEKQYYCKPETAKRSLEKDIERKFVEGIRAKGGRAYKFVSPGTAGVTDRIVLMPVPPEHQALVQKYLKFVELKRPGAKPGPLQNRFISEVRELGHYAGWIDREDLDEV